MTDQAPSSKTAAGAGDVTAIPVPGFTAAEQAVLDDIVRRIVAVAAPERIILFGSAARGDACPDSDLDLLVVKRGAYHPRLVAGNIYGALSRVERPVDVVVAMPETLERYGDSRALVYYPALREGRVIYDAS